MVSGAVPESETERLCQVCAEITEVTGAGLMLMAGEVPRGSVCVGARVGRDDPVDQGFGEDRVSQWTRPVSGLSWQSLFAEWARSGTSGAAVGPDNLTSTASPRGTRRNCS
jgi:hypothetical protein